MIATEERVLVGDQAETDGEGMTGKDARTAAVPLITADVEEDIVVEAGAGPMTGKEAGGAGREVAVVVAAGNEG